MEEEVGFGSGILIQDTGVSSSEMPTTISLRLLVKLNVKRRDFTYIP